MRYAGSSAHEPVSPRQAAVAGGGRHQTPVPRVPGRGLRTHAAVAPRPATDPRSRSRRRRPAPLLSEGHAAVCARLDQDRLDSRGEREANGPVRAVQRSANAGLARESGGGGVPSLPRSRAEARPTRPPDLRPRPPSRPVPGRRGRRHGVARNPRGTASAVVGRAPDLATTEFRIADRGERVLVDIWRNAPSQTAVAPYSPRALPEATVSFPLTWPDLPGARISDFRIGNVQELLDLPGPRAWSQLLTRRARLPTTLTEG
jgi:hypothetical protein